MPHHGWTQACASPRRIQFGKGPVWVADKTVVQEFVVDIETNNCAVIVDVGGEGALPLAWPSPGASKTVMRPRASRINPCTTAMESMQYPVTSPRLLMAAGKVPRGNGKEIARVRIDRPSRNNSALPVCIQYFRIGSPK